ncbi:hypothetical protein [Polyangium jinanense]|uniref:Uncharacterized protein n=2 Tax=Polyangium jinanense TaxID=2829994 RepID=A0A9X3XDN8_9BACT|nr:hypothetical protein [Polyangium jinanense]MDC3960050.1 hypothetical protein [Polyangium jinanense]MDC3986186.1 hypothetical protein [Polyangium jinanense]
MGDDDTEYLLPPEQAAELKRPGYEKYGCNSAQLDDFRAASGRELAFRVNVQLDWKADKFFLGGCGGSALDIGFWYKGFEEGFLLPAELPRLKHGGPSSLAMEAGVAWKIALIDSYDLLVRFCTASPAITTGGCGEGPDWGAPMTMAGTYHADGYPGRDLALTWMRLHDKERIDLAVNSPLDVLRARVEASPRGSSVWIIDEERLAREQVLAALDLPPKVLIEALEAAQEKLHPTWEAMQWELSRLIDEIGRSPADEREMIPVTEEHIRFIEEHTPAYVRRLDNGAIVLMAHPDRTLWPLWSDALSLLGIRP